MKKTLKIVKGILFIAIGILFLFVTFYNFNNEAIYTVDGTNIERTFTFYSAFVYFGYDFELNNFITSNSFNLIFSSLFFGVGILEIIDSGIFKKEGGGNEY